MEENKRHIKTFNRKLSELYRKADKYSSKMHFPCSAICIDVPTNRFIRCCMCAVVVAFMEPFGCLTTIALIFPLLAPLFICLLWVLDVEICIVILCYALFRNVSRSPTRMSNIFQPLVYAAKCAVNQSKPVQYINMNTTSKSSA